MKRRTSRRYQKRKQGYKMAAVQTAAEIIAQEYIVIPGTLGTALKMGATVLTLF